MFIPIIPFPDFYEIFKTIFHKGKFSLSKHFLSKDKPCYQLYSRGSNALACISKSVADKGAVVFIPSYYCNESLDDLRNSSAILVFYNTKMDLTPEWDHVEKLCASYTPDLFLLTHYFGSVNDIDGAIAFCTKHVCKLIHDCAHHLSGSDEILNAPGYILFSPHKILPLPPLSFVVCGEEDFKRLIKPKFSPLKFQDLIWILKRIAQKYFPGLISTKLSETPPDIVGEIHKRNWKVSRVSLLSVLFYSTAIRKLTNVKNIRIENYIRFKDVLLSARNKNQFTALKLNKMSIPYSFVFFNSVEEQKNVYRCMRSYNIPINTWPDLPPEIMLDPIKYKNTLNLRQTLLMLPIHQSLTKNQNKYIENKLREILDGNKVVCGN